MLKHIRSITTEKLFKILPLVFISLFFLTGAVSERSIPVVDIKKNRYVSLDDLIKTFSIEHSFDPVFQKGRLYYRSHYMVYKTGYSCAIIDNSVSGTGYPVIRWKGEVYLPVELAVELLSNFYNRDTVVRGGRLTVAEPVEEIKRPEKKPAKELASKKEKIGFIILDAGHGGKDPGAVGKGGLKEKTITLQLAKKVEVKLKKRLGNTKIKLTRSTDRFIELADRAEIANRELKKGVNGLFVSIHVNASISPRISGFETYFLSQNPTNDEARKTAALENNVVILENSSASKKRYEDADYVEALMMTTQIQKESSMFAGLVQKGIDRNISEFKSNGVHRADFFVLRGALMPAVLVEAGYITNLKEMKLLRTDSYQDKIAEGIADGIADFLKAYNKSAD